MNKNSKIYLNNLKIENRYKVFKKMKMIKINNLNNNMTNKKIL